MCAFGGGEFVESSGDACDESSDLADFLVGWCGFGAGPFVEVAGGAHAFAIAEQVVQVGLPVGQVGHVGAEVIFRVKSGRVVDQDRFPWIGADSGRAELGSRASVGVSLQWADDVAGLALLA